MNRLFTWSILITLTALSCSTGRAQSRSFQISKGQFFLNGSPLQIISGELHYPRIPREYWRDRLLKARAMGLNTICTYVFWNAHEAKPGEFDFSGNLDIATFIKTAQEVGLNVMIRPGPYVCTEWDFGGLPPWLLRTPDIRVRCLDPRYMEAVRRYIQRLGRELAGLQIDRGGPIILLQVENEYGSYGNDQAYTAELARLYRDAGFTVPMYTSDGSDAARLEAGSIEGALPVVNFGEGPEQQFANLSAFRTGIPLMSGEYWCGWFTHWGDDRFGSAPLARVKADVAWMLQTGKSFNLYMFHGGTNFGFSAGANFSDHFEADVTSYDYDAPLDEAGRPTEKFYALQDLIRAQKTSSRPLPEIPPPLPQADLPSITFAGKARLFSSLPQPAHAVQIQSMEMFGQSAGYILYRTTLVGPHSGRLVVTEPHDYAVVYINGVRIGSLDRARSETTLSLPPETPAHARLDILVEALGRINFGPRLIDRKGITERVDLDGVTLMNWQVYLLPMDPAYVRGLKFSDPDSNSGPAFYKARFSLPAAGDAFLDMEGWEKGVVWVNGHNLGRYWSVGPQRRLYVPGVWLSKGSNDVILFDLAGGSARTIAGTAR